MYSSIVNLCAVVGFALSMLIGSDYVSYLVCMFIALGFIPMIGAYAHYSRKERLAAGYTAMLFAGAYAVFILIVYYGQVTALRFDNLSG